MRRDDWRWAAIASACVMALTTLPYLAGWARANPAWHFSGFVFAVDDGNSYIGKMALGARGEWLFHLFYTTEPHRGLLAFSFHLLLGKLAVLIAPPADPVALHDRLVAWYHAARLVFGFGLLLMSYRFCAEFLPLRGQRRLAFFFIALGGGLGWLGLMAGVGGLPLELYSPEAFTFLDLYGLPHLAAARILLLAGFLVCVRALQRPGDSRPVLAGLAAGALWLLMGFIQPLYLIVAYIVLVAYAAELILRRRTIAHSLRVAIPAVALSLPLAVYTALAFQGDPILAQWQRQNLILSPSPFDYLAGWGLWLVPAIFFLALSLPRRGHTGQRVTFLAAWLAVVPIMVYLPYNLQRRFAEGVQLPLVCLAALGLTTGLARLSSRWLRWALAVALALLCMRGTMILLQGGLQGARNPSQPVFVPADEIAAFRWIGLNVAPGSAVLTTFEAGNALPAYAPVRVYLGHGPETAFADRKKVDVRAFFQPYGDDEFRRTLLANNGIDYVLAVQPADGLGFDPASASFLRHEMTSGAYSVYRVTLDSAP